jgi:hypothetical protein
MQSTTTFACALADARLKAKIYDNSNYFYWRQCMQAVFKLAALAIGASLSLTTSHAMAQVISQTSFTQTGWRLIDLDPNDGITPGITFSNFMNHAYTVVVGADNTYYDALNNSNRDSPLGNGTAYQGLSATSNWSDGRSSSLTRVSDQGLARSDQKFSANFVLTPHTTLEYFGSFYGYSGIGSNITPCQWPTCMAGSIAIVDLTGYIDGRFNQGYLARSTAVSQSNSQDSYSQDFNFALINFSDNVATGTLKLETHANAQALTVPEPESYAMLLCGLAALGGLARRRARKFLA